jgi:thiol-disulfide isomerase/thioredoxin
MKPTIYLAALLILTMSCQKKNDYTLNGTFKGAPKEEWIYMIKLFDKNPHIDSAKIENGKFQFKGTIDFPEAYGITYRPDKCIGFATMFLEPGNLNATIDLENWDLNSKVTGGKMNDEFNRFESTRIEKFMKTFWALNDRLPTASAEEKKAIEDSLQLLRNEDDKFTLEYINNHLNSPIVPYILYRKQGGGSIEETGKYLSKLDSSLHNTTIYKRMMEEYENQMQIKNQSEKSSQTNGIEIYQSTIKGDSLLDKLISQNPNKVLYIDVWGTFCGPCRKEFPYSKKLFDKIDHEKIQMVYLCAGSPKNEWEQMVKSEELKGQHYIIDDDNLKNFIKKNSIDNFYGIPRYIIVGKDGKIKNNNAPRPSAEGINDLLAELAK